MPKYFFKTIIKKHIKLFVFSIDERVLKFYSEAKDNVILPHIIKVVRIGVA